jgi:transposase-like protein
MRTSILGKVQFVASKYDPETRGKAVRLVLEHRDAYPSEWAAITAVSKRLGMNAETLRNWIRQQQVRAARPAQQSPPLSAPRDRPPCRPRQYRVTAGQRCPSYRRAISDTKFRDPHMSSISRPC